jgi:hypothetical protein
MNPAPKVAGSDAGVMIGPGRFERMGEFLNVWGALRMPHQETCSSSTESTDGQEYVFHLLLSFKLTCSAYRSLELGCSQPRIGRAWIKLRREVPGGATPDRLSPGWRGRLHFEDGQGSLWTRAWIRGPAGDEDAGDGGGCRDGGKSDGQAEGGRRIRTGRGCIKVFC